MDEVLVGLLVAAEGGPPKKSRPNKEFAGSGCFVGVAALAGADRMLVVSVVLGLTGGDGISPKISGAGAFAAVAAFGRVEEDVDGFCCEAERSSFAFSWTTLSG